ncbi:MAG TPA: acyltransferase [Nitrospiria bacterium]|nr:acyltransferase [Nitrospiria bacterium]
MSKRPTGDAARGAEGSPGYVIPQLTFLRFPAIVWIALFHFGASGFPFSVSPFLLKFVGHGYVAVTFFFVLSGFTLAVRYAGRRIEPTRFMLARLARIYPLYLVGLAVCGLIFAYFGTLQRNLPTLPLNVLLIQAWVPSFALTWNKPCWFLSVLLLFYLIFCLSFDRVSRMTPKTMAYSLTVIWLASLAALVLLKATVYTGEPSAIHDVIFYHPIMHLNSFLIGVGGGLAFRADALQRMAGGRPGWVLATGALVALLGIVAVDDSGYVLHDGLLAPLFLVLIVGVALDTSMVARAFSSRACVALGNLAFAMYILQLPVKAVLLAGVSRFEGRGLSASWISYLVVLLLVSALAVALIEKPFHRMLVGGRIKSA